MEYLAAILFGLSIAAFFYFMMVKRRINEVMSKRIAGFQSELHFPYPVSGQDGKRILKKRLQNSLMNQMLYEAGLRSASQVRFFYIKLSMGVVVPLAIVLVAWIGGQLTYDFGKKALVIATIIFLYNFLSIRWAKKKRQKRLMQALPQFLDLLVVCVEAGLGFAAALQRVLKEMDQNEPITQEFSLMYNEFLRGLSLAEACERLGKRCNVPEVSMILGTVVQSDQMGSSLGKNLRIQAHDLRDKHKQYLREQAHKIPVKIIGPTALIFINIFILTLGPTLYQIKDAFK